MQKEFKEQNCRPCKLRNVISRNRLYMKFYVTYGFMIFHNEFTLNIYGVSKCSASHYYERLMIKVIHLTERLLRWDGKISRINARPFHVYFIKFRVI